MSLAPDRRLSRRHGRLARRITTSRSRTARPREPGLATLDADATPAAARDRPGSGRRIFSADRGRADPERADRRRCARRQPDPDNTGVFGGNTIGCFAHASTSTARARRSRNIRPRPISTATSTGRSTSCSAASMSTARPTDNSYYVNAFGARLCRGAARRARPRSARALRRRTPPPTLPRPPFFRNNTDDFRAEVLRHLRRSLFRVQRPAQADRRPALQHDDKKSSPRARRSSFRDAVRHRRCLVAVRRRLRSPIRDRSARRSTFDAGDRPACRTSQRGTRQRSTSSPDAPCVDYKITAGQSALRLLFARLQVGRHQPAAVSRSSRSPTASRRRSSTPSKSARRTPSATASCASTSPPSTTSTRACSSAASSPAPRSTTMSMPTSTASRSKRSSARSATVVVNVGVSYLHTKVRRTSSSRTRAIPSGGRSDAVIIKDITNAVQLRGRPERGRQCRRRQHLRHRVQRRGIGLRRPGPGAGHEHHRRLLEFCDPRCAGTMPPIRSAPLRALFGDADRSRCRSRSRQRRRGQHQGQRAARRRRTTSLGRCPVHVPTSATA